MIQCYKSMVKCRKGLALIKTDDYIIQELDDVIDEISNNYSEWGDIKQSIRLEVVNKLKRIKKMIKEIKK